LSVVALLATSFLVNPGIAASGDAQSGAVDHLQRSEEALARDEYRVAATEYRKAAEISSSDETARQATILAYNFGFTDEALLAAGRWAKLAPNNDEALLYLAQLQLWSGDWRQSEKSFKKLLKRTDKPAPDRLVSFVPYITQTGSEHAAKLMKRLILPYAKTAAAQYAAGLVALESGDAEAAGEYALRALELQPDWLSAQLLRARAFLMAGDVDAAIDYSEHLVGDVFDPPLESRLELALMYLAASRDQDALSQVNQVLMEAPGRPDAQRLLALINFQLNNMDLAEDDFQDMIASGGNREEAFFYLGRIADFREDYGQAIRFYLRVDSGANAVSAQRRVGGLLLQMGKGDKALEHFTSFARQRPVYAVDMLQAKAQLNISLGRLPEALDGYQKVVQFRPESEGALLGKADLLLRMNRLDESIADFRAAAKRWPNSANSLNALGYTLADRTNEFKEAQRLIEKALQLSPDSPAIMDSYGWVLFRQGRYEESLAALERAYTIMKDPEIAAHLVEVLWQLERKEDAKSIMDEAAGFAPDNDRLRDLRSRLFPNES
jgi:tetratricopeptide (TPR) repeat protein